MGLECTSCGSHMSPTSRMFKCVQCANHIICTLCFHKQHNIASSPFHTMLKIDPVIKLATPGAFIVVEQPKKKVITSDIKTTTTATTSSTLFSSRDYLTQFLGYCSHCLKVMVGNKDEFYTCNQCNNGMFNVCKQCIPLMTVHHPSTHTFTKKVTNGELVQVANNLNHLNTTCSSCRQTNFKGIRYRTKRNDGFTDVCQRCVDKTLRQPIEIIPHPFLIATNRSSLARRAIKVIDRYSHSSDPLTGWTRPYAERILEKSTRDQASYRKYLTTVLTTKESTSDYETDIDWKTAKFGLNLINTMTDPHIIF